MWGKKSSEEQAADRGTAGSFEDAAGRVSALPGSDAEVTESAEAVAEAMAGDDRFIIRPEWAEAGARLIFLPAAKFSHPAYALSDAEAQTISPQIGALMQAIADKYAPALVGRVANKHPEFFDAAAAVTVLYWQKWRTVQRLQREEAEARARAGEDAKPAAPFAVPRPPVGERTADGALVI